MGNVRPLTTHGNTPDHSARAHESDPSTAHLPESRTRDEATAAEDALSLTLSMAAR
jgi:hypothetical protein